MSETEPNQESNYKLTIDNMWSVTRGDTGNWGIEGYEVPREFFDHLKSKEGKVLWEKLNSKKLQSNWPPKLPKDENDKLVWPKRPNFTEDIKKWAESYYNKEKSEKTIEELVSKNKDWDKPPSKKEVSKNLQSFFLHGDRKTNIDWIIHNEKKKYVQYPDREDKITEIKEKIERERKEAKSDIQKIVQKFKTKGSLPKCDRITVVADSEYMGEKVPFCTEPKKNSEEKSPDEGVKANKKFSYKTSYPNILPTWNKDPVWTFNFAVKKDEEPKARKKEAEDERYRTLSERHMERLKKKNLNIELSQTFNKMLNFRKVSALNQEEKDLYKKWTEERPKKQPGPQQYWKTIPYSKLKNTKSMSKSEAKYSTVDNSDGTKSLMIDRKVTDKAIYKPMSSYIF